MPTLRERLDRGQLALGTHVSLGDSVITEALGAAGFDYVWIDMEHSAIGLSGLERHLIAARAAGVTAIVRVPWNDPIRLKPVLEMGPGGVVIPMVNSRQEAEAAVRACAYPPRGTRGYGPRYASRYGRMDAAEYFATVDHSLLKCVQLEHIDAYRGLDGILAVDGIDAFIVGPCDLANSMGRVGGWRHPEVTQVIDDICARVRQAGKKIGASVGFLSGEDAEAWMRRELDMLSLISDIEYICQGADRAFGQMNALREAYGRQ